MTLRILGLGGTTRPGPSSEQALSASLQAAAACGAETVMISGEGLVLPMYSPGEAARQDLARRLVDEPPCDGVIVSSPGHHGSVSGLINSALDHLEDLARDERVYFDSLPAGLIACVAGWQAAGQTLSALRAIAHALRAWPTPLGARLNTSLKRFDDSGACVDLSARLQPETAGRQAIDLGEMAAAHRSARAASHAPRAS